MVAEMKRFNITVNGVAYDVTVEEREDAVSAAEAELARRRSSRRAQRTQDGE